MEVEQKVIVSKEDIAHEDGYRTESDIYYALCGTCALKAMQKVLMSPETVKVEVHSIVKMSEEEARKNSYFCLHGDCCEELDCESPVDYVVVVWTRGEKG